MIIDTDLKFKWTKKIIYIFSILIFLGIIASSKIVKTNYAILGIYIAIPTFLASLTYFIYRKRIRISEILGGDENEKFFISNPDKKFSFLLILYSLGFSLSIIILYIDEIRPFSYYILMTLLATFILFEILFFSLENSKKTFIILFQIFLLTVNLIWGVTLKYYYFIGRTDLIVHTWYIYNLLKDNYITGIFENYQYFPLWHLLNAFVYEVISFDMPIYKLMYILNGIVYGMLTIVIYLISSKIFKDQKIGLVSALFTSINSDILSYGMYSIPRSVETLLESILMLLLYMFYIEKRFVIEGKDRKGEKGKGEKGVNSFRRYIPVEHRLSIGFLILVMIMYHTISMPFILSIFFLIWLLQRIYNIKGFINLKILIFAAVANILYYALIAKNVLNIVIEDIMAPSISGGAEAITKSLENPINELFNYLQYSPLLFFLIIGTLVILESKRFSGIEKVFSITAFLLVWVTFPGPALMINKLAANFNFERFGEYSTIFIVILASIGFIKMYHILDRKIIIILFMIIVLLSISNDFSASDNPLVKRVFYTYYIKESEATSFNHLANITEGIVMSDYVTLRYFQNSPYKEKSNILEINVKKNSFLKNNSKDIILIRDGELRNRPLRLDPVLGGFVANPSEKGNYNYYDIESPTWNDLKNYNRIFDGGDVNGYK